MSKKLTMLTLQPLLLSTILLTSCASQKCEPMIEYVTVYPAWPIAGPYVADELAKLCQNPQDCRYLEMWLNKLKDLSQILNKKEQK